MTPNDRPPNNSPAGRAAAAGVFLAAIAAYLITAPPGLLFEDDPSILFSALSLGVPRAPGWPLLTALAHPFTLLPIEPRFALGVAGAVFISLSAAALFLMLRAAGIAALAAAAAALAFALSRSLWSAATTVGPFPLEILILAAALWLLLAALTRRRAAAFIPLALAACFAHARFAFLALLPIAAVPTILRRPRSFDELFRRLIASLFIFFLGASIYMQLPLFSARGPAADWGAAHSPKAFHAHVTDSALVQDGPDENIRLDTFKKYIADFILNLPAELTLPFVFLAATGLCLAFMERPAAAAALLYLFSVFSAGMFLFARFHFIDERISEMRLLTAASFTVAAVFIALALTRFRDALRQPRIADTALAAAAAALLAWQAAAGFSAADARASTIAPWFGAEIIDETRRDAVLMLQDDYYTAAAGWKLLAAGVRPDIAAFDNWGSPLKHSLGPPPDGSDNRAARDTAARIDINAFPVYSSYPGHPLPAAWRIGARNEGLIFSLHPNSPDQCDPELRARRLRPPDLLPDLRPGGFRTRFIPALLETHRADCLHTADIKIEAAVAAERIAETLPDSVTVHLSLARVYQHWNDNSRANSAYTRALELCPACAEIYVELGDIVFERKFPERAVDLYQKALALKPGDDSATLGLANVHMNQGRYQKAIEMYNRLLRDKPRHALALNNLGNAYEQIHDSQKAEMNYRKALEADPQLPLPRLNLATMLISRGKPAEAVDQLAIYLKLDPASPYGYYNLGVAFYQLRSLDRAETAFRKALKITPGFFEARANLLKILLETGQKDAANILIDETQQLYPKAKEQINWLRKQIDEI